MEHEVRQIMFEKLKEMAKLDYDDCGCGEYPNVCSVMNEIANAFLNENSLRKFSVSELIEELETRDSVEVIEREYYYLKDESPLRFISLKVSE